MITNIAYDKFQTLILSAGENCSDLHITTNHNCFYRIDGTLSPVHPPVIFNNEEICALLDKLLYNKNKQLLYQKRAVDLSSTIKNHRLRISIYKQNNETALAVRLIKPNINSLENDSAYPDILKILVKKTNGLILITGPSGAGKSTTLASMIKYRAEYSPCHIITLEDPIEYLLTSQKSLIHQREYGRDFFSFSQALKNALRQDPDILLIGEIRDKPTMQAALTAAQTGHLVLSTLHTANVPESITRIESLFSEKKQNMIRQELSTALQGIISQKLLLRKTGGRIPAMEILLSTDAVRNLIVSGKPQQISSIIQTNKKIGMQTMTMSIASLKQKNFID
ncbi:type IV pilus twitching motility protein PilT [Pectinatus sottacetonis]|uniref:type IV pilus twitching motility protein PilT n=1 Tax=Pectinatus sottacetonis TaxID=1002795 RepID=UPI0018C593B9|nr:PilT/PilU family type 4a pilus ATPase [Pectinatus sottacetonis]